MSIGTDDGGKKKASPEKAVVHQVAITLDMQIAELEREIGMRGRFYSQWIFRGTLRKQDALRQAGALKATLETLRFIRDRKNELPAVLTKLQTVEVIV